MEWSKGSAERVNFCPACGSDSATADYSRRDDFLRIPDIWGYSRCGDCSSVFLAVRPDASSIYLAYEEYPTHNDAFGSLGLSEDGFIWGLIRDYLYRRFGVETSARRLVGGKFIFSMIGPLRLKLDRFGRHVHLKHGDRGSLKLMDVGCGNGEFLSLAGLMGLKASGIDPDEKAVSVAVNKGLDVRLGGFDLLSRENEAYDIVTMNQVVEHVFDQRELLSSCYSALREDGLLWMAYPNPEAIGLRVFGSAWCALHPPYHICLTSQGQMRKILAEAGFRDIKVHRRGIHAKAHWRDSAAISEAHQIPIPSSLARRVSRTICDLLAALTPRWSEEVVITARKP
ncbi:class I SAM-dependent methyltransferase [Pseudomonas sp. C9-3]|uniref:class I SAM-dependent methyltransferase n=1 Tax=Pseudomonas sp. C9-3 TaxID=3078264 RepID=UPI0028E5D58A|nr:class I SAM-dependent methyltransferase [Pseudomonas sp. C9-3]